MNEKDAKKLFLTHGKIDRPFFIMTMSLLLFGLIMLFSASHANAYYYEGDSYYYIKRQAIYACIGLVALFVTSHFNYKNFKNLAYPLWVLSVALLFLTYFMRSSHGANRWIYIGSFSFQPSEIAKFALIILFAKYISENQSRIKSLRYGTIPLLGFMLVIATETLFQPHVSGTILIGIICLTMMFVGGCNFKHILSMGVCAVGLVVTAVFIKPDLFNHVINRINYFINPWLDAQNKGYQIIQSLLAIGSGGLLGVGFGESVQKYAYLPEVQNDFIYPIIAEELGFIGAALVIVLFAALIWRGFHIAIQTRDRFGSLIAVGITVQIGIQAFLNIAVVTKTVPNTGISLPFFSYGGTSLVVILAQIGVLLAVSRNSNYEKE